MKRALFLACASVAIIGCGGGGNNGTFDDPNPFFGTWDGFIRAANNPDEDFRLTIAENGSITGSETVGSATAALTGTVNRNGDFNILSQLAGSQDVRYTGRMRFISNSRLEGIGTGRQGDRTVDIYFEVQRVGF